MSLRDLFLLLRPRIGLLAGAGALAGGLAWSSAGNPDPRGLALGLGLGLIGALCLSAGCSALNQVQERREDARMARTKDRPLPGGRLRPRTALALALALLALGGLALAVSPGGSGAALLAPLAVLLYNGLYTPLKKRTSLALLVGGLAGALPPVVGFAAAGGSPLDPRALLLAGIFYAWQVPHFWLFARLHREEYAAAGFFAPHDAVGEARLAGTLALWLCGYGALLLLAAAFGLVALPALKAVLVLVAAALALGARPMLRRPRQGFALVNASLLLFLCCLAADALRLAA